MKIGQWSPENENHKLWYQYHIGQCNQTVSDGCRGTVHDPSRRRFEVAAEPVCHGCKIGGGAFLLESVKYVGPKSKQHDRDFY